MGSNFRILLIINKNQKCAGNLLYLSLIKAILMTLKKTDEYTKLN